MAKKEKLLSPPKPRTKRKPNSGQFKKGNEHRFQPGVSPNPGGKPKSEIEKSITAGLHKRAGQRAPDSMCAQLDLPPYSTYSDCAGAWLFTMFFNRENPAWAALVLDRLEGKVKEVIGLDANINNGEPAPEKLIVEFVSSQYTQEHPEEASGVETPKHALPPPLIEARSIAIKDAHDSPAAPIIDEAENEVPGQEPFPAPVREG